MASQPPRALLVEDQLPTWEDATEVVASPVEFTVYKALTEQRVTVGSVLLGLVLAVVYWNRRMRNK